MLLSFSRRENERADFLESGYEPWFLAGNANEPSLGSGLKTTPGTISCHGSRCRFLVAFSQRLIPIVARRKPLMDGTDPRSELRTANGARGTTNGEWRTASDKRRGPSENAERIRFALFVGRNVERGANRGRTLFIQRTTGRRACSGFRTRLSRISRLVSLEGEAPGSGAIEIPLPTSERSARVSVSDASTRRNEPRTNAVKGPIPITFPGQFRNFR